MGKVLFVSQNPLGRCENLTAVYNAYDGEKEFRHDVGSMRTAEDEGFSVVVCDCLPVAIENKSRCKSVNIGHGITGDKTYGADENTKPWFDEHAASQTDYAICPSTETVDILARQLCLPVNRVLPLGMPRTDAYFGYGKRDDGKRIYLYAPTFRYDWDGYLPVIDWGKLDSILDEDEVVVVKRHYFTKEPLVDGEHRHILEVSPDEPCGKHVIDCDVLITDYSSIVYDAYIAGKPVVLTIDDKDIYLKERGMYYEYPESYSSRWLCVYHNEGRLVDILQEAASNGMGDVEKKAVSRVADACDGHSTERVVELVKALAEG